MREEPPTTVAGLLAKRLHQRGWTQADLAHVVGWSVQGVSDVAHGRRIDARDALDLAAAFDDSGPEVWLSAQTAHELWSVHAEPRTPERLTAIQSRRELEEKVPTRDLIRRGLIPKDDQDGQLRAVLELLGVQSIDQDPPFAAAMRRRAPATPPSRRQIAWIACARFAARCRSVGEYTSAGLRQLAASLSATVRQPEDFATLPDRFAEVGVRLVHVDPFPGGRIDGVATDIAGTPVIALSGYGGRFDKVLFTLAHECGHIALGHVGKGRILDAQDEASTKEPIEIAADDLAASWIVPDGFLPATGTFTRSRIRAIAAEAGVSEAVVIGRLQKAERIPWNSVLNRLIPSVKEVLADWN